MACLELGEEACNCCQEVEDHLAEKGINVITDARMEAVLGDEKVTSIKLSNGQGIKADLLIVGIGVRLHVSSLKKQVWLFAKAE